MKKTVNIPVTQDLWSLAADITYASVPTWYNATVKDLKCSIIMPKARTPEKKYPLLIWICGGAFKVMDRNVWLPQWIDFARKGCIVASIEYRTSNEAVFPAALIDVKAAIRFLKANSKFYSIDPERVFIAGESAGGTLASLAGVTGKDAKYEQGAYLEYSSEVQGVIDFYGITDLTGKGIKKTTGDTAGAEEQFIGYEGDYRELAREASALYHITPGTPPFLIMHGDKDDLVDISQSEKLYDALIKAGVRADFYVFEGAGHGADEFYQAEPLNIIRNFMDSI